jgi:hypothetical protein
MMPMPMPITDQIINVHPLGVKSLIESVILLICNSVFLWEPCIPLLLLANSGVLHMGNPLKKPFE